MIHLYALGQSVLTVGQTRLTPSSETLFATALYLVLEAGRTLCRRELQDIVWPEADARRSGHRLRQILYRLNALGAGVHADRDHVMLAPERACTDYGPLLAATGPAHAEHLAASITGPFLHGYTPHVSVAFNEWLERQRDLAHAAFRRMLVTAVQEKRSRGEWAVAEQLADRCLRIDPLNEHATIAIAEAAARSGSKHRAIEILDAYAREVDDTLPARRHTVGALRRRIAAGADEPPAAREPRFVGRDRELAELEHACELAGAANGAAYLVSGEAGIGKSRLVQELVKSLAARGTSAVELGCQPTDEQRPLSVVVDLIPKLLPRPGALGCTPESLRLLRRLAGHDAHGAAGGAGGAGGAVRESEFSITRLARALFDLLDAIASEAPLVLVVEDVHWLDRNSWQVLRHLASWCRQRRVLALLTSRRGSDARLSEVGDGALPSRLSLRPLEEHASRALLLDVLAGSERAANAHLIDWCIEASGGNPYYLAELGTRATWDGTRYVAPVSLDRLVRDRLERLAPLSRRVLQASSLLGKLSTTHRIEALLATSRVHLLQCLEELDDAGLVHVHDDVLRPKHHLLADAALALLTPASLAFLHRKAAEVLDAEREHDASTSLLWECAEHWQRGGAAARAIGLLRSCAQHLLRIGLPRDAALTLQRASRLAATRTEQTDLLKEGARALVLAGAWSDLIPIAGDVTRAGRTDAEPAPHDHDDLELDILQARWRLGEPNAHLLRDALHCVEAESASIDHRVRAATWALVCADNLCDARAASAVYRAACRIARAGDAGDPRHLYLHLVYHTSFGDLDLAHRFAERLVQLAAGEADPSMAVRLLTHCAVALRLAGDREGARSAATEGLRLASEKGLARHAANPEHQLAMIALSESRLEAAEQWFQRAIGRLTDSPDTVLRSTILATGADVSVQRRDLATAESRMHESAVLLEGRRWPRADARYAAFRWYTVLLRGATRISEHDLRSLVSLHRRARASTGQDRLTLVIGRLLVLRDRPEHARDLVRTYLARYRRERGPLDPELDALRRELCGEQERDGRAGAVVEVRPTRAGRRRASRSG